MNLSVVIPAHNEGKNIESFVTAFVGSISPDVRSVLGEIIIVENGSRDNTVDACRQLEKRFSSLIRIVSIPRGSYGEAIKAGMLQSRGTHVSILECDLLDPTFLSKSVALFDSRRAEVVIGSKRHAESIDRRPVKRRLLTALYNLVFLRVCFGYPGTDTHGLKSLELKLAQNLCRIAVTGDEVFQTELILLAWRNGAQIQEVPVQILEKRSSSISVTRRLPKVINTWAELRRSINRFPKSTALRPDRTDGQSVGARLD